MSSKCSTYLQSCISADCDNPLFAGVAPDSIIINYDQAEFGKPVDNIIGTITMGTDATTQTQYKAYCCSQLGKNPYEGSQTELVEGTYGNKWNHTVVLAVPDNGPEISHNIIDNLANGRFACILTNDYVHADGKNKYQVYGASKGLRASSIVRELYGDNNSFWIVTLVEENAPTSGLFFYKTDDETTDAYLNSIKDTCCNIGTVSGN